MSSRRNSRTAPKRTPAPKEEEERGSSPPPPWHEIRDRLIKVEHYLGCIREQDDGWYEASFNISRCRELFFELHRVHAHCEEKSNYNGKHKDEADR